MPNQSSSGSLRTGLTARHAGGLPCPMVVLGPEYLKRLERLSLRFAAGLERREGAGRAGLLGSGEEFVTSRPTDLERICGSWTGTYWRGWTGRTYASPAGRPPSPGAFG